jgi:hypothetical protein
MQSFPLPCYLVPLGPKYPPHHPILESPQPTFLPQCERPIFTTIRNKRQDYSSVYLHLYIFGQQIGRRKIQQRMITINPRLQSALNLFTNGMLIHQGFSQIFKLCRSFKEFITYLYVDTFSCILISRHYLIHSFLSIYYKPVSLLAITKASISL